MNRLTVSDFFCGAGGFSEGFHQAGFNVVFALDNWKPAKETHDLNHPNCKCIQKNILDIKPNEFDDIVPDTDVIIGSPPCVSFSNSNKSGKADKTLGLKLIEKFLQIVSWKIKKGTCKYWIMENVPNSKNFIKSVYTWKELNLPGEGPDLQIPNINVLIASDYGTPQDRKRCICGNYPMPKINENKIHIKDIMDCLGPPLNNNQNKFKDIYSGEEYDEICDHLYDSTIDELGWKRAKRLKTDHGFMGAMSFPDKLTRCCRTIMATQSASTREAIIFKKENSTNEYRLPTIRELSCLMGYPINYQFEGNEGTKHKLIGNAVCPPFAKALADAIVYKEFLEPASRNIIKSKVNLNHRVLVKSEVKAKSISNKFHIHIPYLKITGLRVELDNIDSELIKHYSTIDKIKNKLGELNIEYTNKENKNDLLLNLLCNIKNPFKWKTLIHKGSGKGATKCYISYIDLQKYIDQYVYFNEFKNELDNLIHKKIYDSTEFQKKNCLINESNHFSPMELLENIKKLIVKFEISNDDIIQVEQAKPLYKNEKKDLILSIIFGQWALDYSLSKLN